MAIAQIVWGLVWKGAAQGAGTVVLELLHDGGSIRCCGGCRWDAVLALASQYK